LHKFLFVFLLNTISPTDENIFAEPPSRFYLTRDIPFSLNGSRKDPSDTSKTDTLKSGFLLMKLNNPIPRDSAQLVEVIKSLPNGLEVPISVFNNITLKFEKGKVLSNYITPDLFKFLHSAILIVDVTPGGASETAGIQVGDYILKVRGSNFRSPTEADSILRATESGRFIPYKVLRDNNEFEVDVKLAKFGINFIVLLAFIAALIYLFLGEPRDALMLLSFVFVVIGMSFYQEQKTQRALEALRDLSSPRALVVRGGDQRRIAGREVVREDIIVLREGDRIPADAAAEATA